MINDYELLQFKKDINVILQDKDNWIFEPVFGIVSNLVLCYQLYYKTEEANMKEKIEGIDCSWFKDCVYYKQCERLKQENNTFVKAMSELNKIILKKEKQIEEYKQALEEIRKYCEEQNLKADYTACEVLTIIDEVLND